MKLRNELVPFGVKVLEVIVKIQESGGRVPENGKDSINGVITTFLNDKGYIDIESGEDNRYIRLSKKGFELYDSLIEYVSKDIGVTVSDSG